MIIRCLFATFDLPRMMAATRMQMNSAPKVPSPFLHQLSLHLRNPMPTRMCRPPIIDEDVSPCVGRASRSGSEFEPSGDELSDHVFSSRSRRMHRSYTRRPKHGVEGQRRYRSLLFSSGPAPRTHTLSFSCHFSEQQPLHLCPVACCSSLCL